MTTTDTRTRLHHAAAQAVTLIANTGRGTKREGDVLAELRAAIELDRQTPTPAYISPVSAADERMAEERNAMDAADIADHAADAERFRTEFLNELLSEIPEEWDADEAAEAIAIDYVRHLEAEVKRLGGRFYPWADALAEAPPATPTPGPYTVEYLPYPCAKNGHGEPNPPAAFICPAGSSEAIALVFGQGDDPFDSPSQRANANLFVQALTVRRVCTTERLDAVDRLLNAVAEFCFDDRLAENIGAAQELLTALRTLAVGDAGEGGGA